MHTPMLPACTRTPHTWPPALYNIWVAGLQAVDAAPRNRSVAHPTEHPQTHGRRRDPQTHGRRRGGRHRRRPHHRASTTAAGAAAGAAAAAAAARSDPAARPAADLAQCHRLPAAA